MLRDNYDDAFVLLDETELYNRLKENWEDIKDDMICFYDDDDD